MNLKEIQYHSLPVMGQNFLGYRTKHLIILLLFLGITGCTSQKEDLGNRQPLSIQSSKEQAKKEESVWVTKPDQALSCEPQSGESLTQGSDELKSAKIPILDSQKGSDNKMHIQVCGASKGSMNSYLIPKKNLKDAIALGYQEIVNQPEGKN